MTIQTLVVTMNQSDNTLVEKMNIQTDCIVGNQCGRNSTEHFVINGYDVSFLNTDERGVGKNRNLALENATADICVLADDDMRFIDNYPQIVKKAFETCNDADVLIFNLIEKNPERHSTEKVTRVTKSNYAKYGAARFALKRKSIVNASIKFSLSFGGGTEHGSGEDTIFLNDCLKKKLKIYTVPLAIAEMDQGAVSTWFNGYNDKFFSDKGALYYCLHPAIWVAYCTRFVVKYRYKFGKSVSLIHALGCMIKGAVKFMSEKNNEV